MICFEEICAEGEGHIGVGEVKKWKCRDAENLFRRLRQRGTGFKGLKCAVAQWGGRSQGCGYIGNQIGQVV